MNRIFLAPVLCGIALLLAITTWAEESEQQARQGITATLERQVQAWNAGDLDQFMTTYWRSDDLSFSSAGRTTRGWQATLERYRTRYPNREQMGRLRLDNLEITLLADTAAMVLGNWHLERDGDQPQGNFTLVMRRIEGEWLIIHDHTSLLADEGPAQESSEQDAGAVMRRFEQLGATPLRDQGKLTGFRFDGTDVSDADLRGIAALGELTDLSLEQTQIGDEGIAHLQDLKNLEWLNLYQTQITDHALATIAALPAIRFLPIGRTRIGDEGLKHIGQLKRLRYLGLRGTSITDAGLVHLRELRLLEGLHLGETQITDEGLQQLTTLSGLRELWLQKTRITDRSVDVLSQFTGLKQLVLAETGVSAEAIARLQQALPKCQIITELSGESP